MSSQSPAPPDGVKSEEPAAEETAAEETAAEETAAEETTAEETAAEEPVVKTESSNATSTVLSNELLKIMKGIVDYLTEYKDEK
jgi:hypothetical protein